MNFAELGNTSVIGLQWGDEGKGKIVDLLTPHFDVVVRYAGGANAGHTVRVGQERFALHLLPSGILRPGVRCLIGPGVALDLEILVQEIERLRARGFQVGDNLLISDRAHLVMPYHKKQDRLADARLDPGRRIGTTAKGIGPMQADKMLRTNALRVCDLYRPERFRERVSQIVEERNRWFAVLYGDAEPLDGPRIADEFLAHAQKVVPHVTDTLAALHQALDLSKRVLFEGAQGSLLDIHYGTFPFVTSNTCIAGGVAAGAGIPPSKIRSYVGVMKAYSTRVGEGPFPSELNNSVGDRIRERGHEYGTTTGRPRRCGWFDACAARYAARLSGITEIALMHLDTLASFDEVLICTRYRRSGRDLTWFPADAEILEEVEPVHETMPGWPDGMVGVDRYEQLPDGARRYVDRLESLLGVPITLVSIGAERMSTLHRPQAPVMAR